MTIEFEQLIQTIPEVGLYMLIESMGGMQWRLNHDSTRDHSRGYLSDAEAESMQADARKLTSQLGQAVDQTIRFGVSRPREENGSGSEEYFRWYRWWREWEKGLSDTEYRRIDNALVAKEDISQYRPEGDWRLAASKP